MRHPVSSGPSVARAAGSNAPWLRCIVLGLLLLVLAPAARAATPTGPYWIVAGSFSDPDYTQVQYEAVRQASAAVTRCGLEPFNDFSGKFIGFTEGFDVVVVGGYPSRAAAERDLARLRPCVPTADIRKGTYAGE